MVTKAELLVSINEIETKLNTANVTYTVANVSIKSLKVELENYLQYLVSVELEIATTNLTKYQTSNTQLDVTEDVRVQQLTTVDSFSTDDQVMQQLGNYHTVETEYRFDPDANVSIAQIEKTSITAVSSLVSNYSNDNADLSVSGSGQDSVFWLRRVSIELTNQVLTQQQYSRLKDKQIAGDITVNDLLERSEQVKRYLTFRCEQLSNDDLAYFDRINWIVETDDTWGDLIVYPDYSKVTRIKFATIIRLLKYRINNPLLVNNECLLNRYFGRDEILRCPLVIALDLLTDHVGVNHNNSVLASAMKVDTLGVDRTVFIRKLHNGSEIHRPLHTTFVVPCEERTAINNSVELRTIGKVKRALVKQRTNSKQPNYRDDWQLLSTRKTTTEVDIIAINSPKYRDCVLIFKRYQLELNPVTKRHDHPTWLLKTQSRYGIKDNEIVGYVGIRYPNGKVEKTGIVHTKYVKKQDKTVLWFSLLEKTATTISNRVVQTGNERLEQTIKYIKTDKTIQKQLVTRIVPETTLAAVTEITKIDVDPDIAIFLSLYGLCNNTAVKPAKLNTVNGEQKHIAINWSTLTGLRVAPINKQGDIQWHPKYNAPFTVLA